MQTTKSVTSTNSGWLWVALLIIAICVPTISYLSNQQEAEKHKFDESLKFIIVPLEPYETNLPALPVTSKVASLQNREDAYIVTNRTTTQVPTNTMEDVEKVRPLPEVLKRRKAEIQEYVAIKEDATTNHIIVLPRTLTAKDLDQSDIEQYILAKARRDQWEKIGETTPVSKHLLANAILNRFTPEEKRVFEEWYRPYQIRKQLLLRGEPEDFIRHAEKF